MRPLTDGEDRITDPTCMPDPTVSVIVPAFNEERTIAQALSRLIAAPFHKEIIVVDDGSSDATAEKARGFDGVKVIVHARNCGKGVTIRTGLAQCTGAAVIVHDADLEYDPFEIPLLVERLTGDSPVVHGSRFLGRRERMRVTQSVGNRLVTCATNVFYRAHLTDMMTCYKLMARSVYRRLQLRSDGFDVDAEIIAKVLRMGITIVEVPISYHGRTIAEGKKITWRDGVSAVAKLWSYRGWVP